MQERGSSFAEEFLGILDEADEDDHGRTGQADKEHHFQRRIAKIASSIGKL